jgi:hypothetical protein
MQQCKLFDDRRHENLLCCVNRALDAEFTRVYGQERDPGIRPAKHADSGVIVTAKPMSTTLWCRAIIGAEPWEKAAIISFHHRGDRSLGRRSCFQ